MRVPSGVTVLNCIFRVEAFLAQSEAVAVPHPKFMPEWVKQGTDLMAGVVGSLIEGNAS